MVSYLKGKNVIHVARNFLNSAGSSRPTYLNPEKNAGPGSSSPRITSAPEMVIVLVPVAFNPAENTASSKALVRDSAILGKTCLLEEGSRPRSRLLRRALARRQAGPRGNLPKRRGPATDFLHQLKMLMLNNRPLFGGTEISLRWTGRTKNSGCFSKKPSLLNVKFTFHILRQNFL